MFFFVVHKNKNRKTTQNTHTGYVTFCEELSVSFKVHAGCYTLYIHLGVTHISPSPTCPHMLLKHLVTIHMDKQEHRIHNETHKWSSIIPGVVRVWMNLVVCWFWDLCRGVVSTVGKSFELVLVDLLDDAVVHGCQDRFFTCKVLVKVIDVPFGFL